MINAFNTYIGLLFFLIIAVSCAEEKQYSHREEIITQKIWKEDSMNTTLLLETLQDTLHPDSSRLPTQLDSASLTPSLSP